LIAAVELGPVKGASGSISLQLLKTLDFCFTYPTSSLAGACVHHVTSFLENNNYVRCLVVDFSKVFDIVDHAVIVEKSTKLPLPWNVIN
jgi:hypothetical protein